MLKQIFSLIISILIFNSTALAIEGKINEFSEIEKRRIIIDDWLAAAQGVADVTQNEDALLVADFLRDAGTLFVPVAHIGGLATMVAEKTEDKKYVLGLTPLINKDQEISADWKKFFEMNRAASFIEHGEASQIVFSTGEKISRFWKGFILVHEGGHAFHHITGRLDEIKDPALKKAAGEYLCYQLEFDLISQIGGAPYKKLLEREKTRLKKEYLKGNIVPPNHQKSLDDIFGQPLSEHENGIRNMTLWLNAYFTVLNEIFKTKEEQEDAKISLLLDMYEQKILD